MLAEKSLDRESSLLGPIIVLLQLGTVKKKRKGRVVDVGN